MSAFASRSSNVRLPLFQAGGKDFTPFVDRPLLYSLRQKEMSYAAYAGTGGCDSTANSSPAGIADDIQVVAVGGRSGVCVLEVGTDVLQDGDDIDTTGDAAGAGMILTGANGICDTDNTPPLPADAIRIINVGSSTPNTVGILAGPNGALDTTIVNGDDTLGF